MLQGAWLPLIAFFLSGLLGCTGEAAPEDVRAALQEAIAEAEAPAYLSEPDGQVRFWEELQAFYQQRSFHPAWTTAEGPSSRLHDLVELFCSAGEEGLSGSMYASQTLASALKDAYAQDLQPGPHRAHQLASLDVLLTHTLMRYATDLLQGRVPPEAIDSTWNIPRRRVDVLQLLGDSLNVNTYRQLGRRLSAHHPAYDALKEVLARYRTLAAQGGWQEIPEGELLKPGMQDERVPLLRQRLLATNDLPPEQGPAPSDTTRLYQYDGALVEAVRRFQRRHGLEPDEIIGAHTRKILNVPIEERIRQIILNMERWRWMPDTLGRRYIHVNIPAFMLYAYEDSREVLRMSVVTGEEYEDNATPTFVDTMDALIFHPYWNIPESIAEKEILPKARQDRSFLTENHYEVVSDWSVDARVFDPDTVDLSRVESGEYRLRQTPGLHNELGQIKFILPNRYNIYLHDTRAVELFRRAYRAFSHGCIRVEQPVELAAFTLAKQQDGPWPRSRIQAQMDRGSNHQEVTLDAPLPVYILYWTTFVDDAEQVHFRSDLYGKDSLLFRALRPHLQSAVEASCPAQAALQEIRAEHPLLPEQD